MALSVRDHLHVFTFVSTYFIIAPIKEVITAISFWNFLEPQALHKISVKIIVTEIF